MAGTLTGFVYALIEDGWRFFQLVNGTVAGLVIGVTVSLLELFLFAGRLRRIPFTHVFGLRVFIYFMLAVAITFSLFLFSRGIRFNLGYKAVLNSEEFQSYLNNEYPLVLFFCFLAITTGVFILQMARKLGVENLFAFVTGKYLTPKRERRIFMFLSLEGVDNIIEQTGNLEFHNFLNDFIHDISDTIRIHKGYIVHYMEDQIVITWKIKAGAENANCLRTYFQICFDTIENYEYYHTQYGFLPKPKCAIHSGVAIRAEIGEIKSEIAFFGDVLNTTSRILYETIRKGVDILVSQSVMELVQVPIHYKVESAGSFTPRGRSKSIQLYYVHLRHDE